MSYGTQSFKSPMVAILKHERTPRLVASTLLNLGANKANVSDLSDYISNEVFKLQHDTVGSDGEEIDTDDNDQSSHSSIRIATASILTREPKNG